MTVHTVRVADPDAPTAGTAAVATSSRSRPWLPFVAVLALALAVVGSATIGATSVESSALWQQGHPDHGVAAARLDRTALGLAVGAALALAGVLLQGLTRNPVADPGLLGINAGASMAVVVAISLLGISTTVGYVWAALLGAAAAGLLVHTVAALGPGGATPVKIAVSGAAVTAAVTSLTSALLLADRAAMTSYRFWSVGTLGGRDWSVLSAGLPFLAVGVVLAFAGARLLDALALGDDVARALGRRVQRDRVVVGLAAVLLAGTATALAGPIAFVGLVVPHVVRAFTGPRHALLLVWSAVVGATLVLVADTVGRVVAPPSEVQVGVMAAIIGLPFFLVLVRRIRGGGL